MVRTVGEDESERKVIDDIAQFGWHCIHIAADDEGVGYSFTIGLFHRYGYPELIVMGLPHDTAHAILAAAADAAASTHPPHLDRPTDALVEHYPCRFAPVPSSVHREYVGYARWYYRGDDFSLHQIAWPSKSGLYPWDDGAPAGFKDAQPIIAERPSAV